MILEIALGIVLAAIILIFWPAILVVGVIIGLVILLVLALINYPILWAPIILLVIIWISMKNSQYSSSNLELIKDNKNMDSKKQNSYIYYFKCKPCQLEFSAFSWKNDWDKKPFCPECGKQEARLINKISSEEPISSLVHRKTI